MNNGAGPIRGAWERVRREEYLARRRRNLGNELSQVEAELAALDRRLAAERRDVARLRGLSGLRAALAGDKEDRLLTERVEAEAIRLRVEGHRARMGRLSGELGSVEAELGALADARGAYDAVIASHARAAELADVGRRLVGAEADLGEHEEAISAGGVAWRTAREAAAALRRVGAAAAVDDTLLGLLRQGLLGAADRAAWEAEQALGEFTRQLTDLRIQSSVAMPRADLMWFTEWFFDEELTVATRRERLLQVVAAVDGVERWVQGMLDHLTSRHGGLLPTRGQLRQRWDTLLGGR